MVEGIELFRPEYSFILEVEGISTTGCPVVRGPNCIDVQLSGAQLSGAQLSWCPVVLVPSCSAAQLSRYPVARFPIVMVPTCPMPSCPGDQLSGAQLSVNRDVRPLVRQRDFGCRTLLL